METTFPSDCPYCGTKRAGFLLVNEISGNFDLANPYQITSYSSPKWMAYGICPVCSHGIIVYLNTGGDAPPSVAFRLNNRSHVVVMTQIPGTPDHSAPEYTPEEVSRFYRQGAASLPHHPDAAGAMFRKSLEKALSHEFPNITGRLFDRIQEAVQQGALTLAMGQWAHQIRLDGNEAVHGDEPFSLDDARRLETFTDLVFRYLFTLPGMLKKARGTEKGASESQP